MGLELLRQIAKRHWFRQVGLTPAHEGTSNRATIPDASGHQDHGWTHGRTGGLGFKPTQLCKDGVAVNAREANVETHDRVGRACRPSRNEQRQSILPIRHFVDLEPKRGQHPGQHLAAHRFVFDNQRAQKTLLGQPYRPDLLRLNHSPVTLSEIYGVQSTCPNAENGLLLLLTLSLANADVPARCEEVAVPEPPDPAPTEPWVASEESDQGSPTGWRVVRGSRTQFFEHQAWGVAVRGTNRGDSWLEVDALFTDSQQWMARFSGGIDLMGHSPLDAVVGVVLGHVGDWQTLDHQRVSVGTVLELGWHPRPFLLSHRLYGGKRPDEAGFRYDSRTMAGVLLVDRVEVLGHLSVVDSGAGAPDIGLGLGAGLRF